MSSSVAPPPGPATSTDGRPAVAPPATPAADARASALLGWAALTLILVAGVPIFLCLPFWFDVYHYDVCARTLMRGGVLYRDVFDNNLPGVVWLQTGLRMLVGWRPEALHLADLVIFSVSVCLLLTWVRRGVRVWAAAAMYAFYLFVPESCPCQRDIWMLCPALVCLALRRHQLRRLSHGPGTFLSALRRAALEGLCWGAVVWIKPFIVVPAFVCWVVSALQLRRARADSGRPLAGDVVGLLAGGLLAGALGLAWLRASGSWPYFWDIVLDWNKDYAAYANKFEVRYISLAAFLLLFLPWSLVPFVAAALAVGAVRRAFAGDAKAPAASADPNVPAVALLAAFFLGWLFQAVFLQLPHDYALAPTMPAAIALVACLWRPARTSFGGAMVRMTLLGVMAFLWVVAFRLDRITLWPRCCREGATPQVQSLLATRTINPYCPDPAPLADVAAYLRSQKVGDGELTCMSGCTHGLYLDLGVRPSTRFPQVEMTTLFFTKHRETVLAELNASRQRFVVSDLVWTGMTPEAAKEVDPNDPLGLPPKFPEEFAFEYPWREPIVFRSGRYLVHRVTGPATRFWLDDTEDVSEREYKTWYDAYFAGRLSFRDEAAAQESVGLIDALYRRSDAAGDEDGRHAARRAALTMFDRAREAGKDREADVFRRWLEARLDEGAPAGP